MCRCGEKIKLAAPLPLKNMVYIGMDNGVSNCGIVALTDTNEATLFKLPIKKELSYTKIAKNITRIDYPKLVTLFNSIKDLYPNEQILVGLERPMVNSTRFTASMSAIRALEATLIALEETGLAYQYLDSKEWQHVMLPKNLKGSDALKKASLDIGKRMFPALKLKKDADGLLIAAYLRKQNNRKL